MKAATCKFRAACYSIKISIHAAREGGDCVSPPVLIELFNISIHAAREGGDVVKSSTDDGSYISIHAAREGGDFLSFLFLSKSL